MASDQPRLRQIRPRAFSAFFSRTYDMIDPDRPSADEAIDDRPVRAVVDDALAAWHDLTAPAGPSTRLGDWDLRAMNAEMEEALRLEPDGTTAYMLLEIFLRDYLDSKTFTAGQIMRDYAATTAFLERAEKAFSRVQSPRATEIAAQFRERTRQGVRRYRADRPDVLELIDDPDALPFLRRDALRSIETLKAYQFLAGDADPGTAQVIENVYISWNVNDLLLALRDMPVSGIAVVLLRDPANPDRSYFAFAMRNGGNVILFTDRTMPAYPGQDDVLAKRGGRGIGRRFMKRAWANHFPYQLIETKADENGDIRFVAEQGLVLAGRRVVPAMRIADLPAHQAIWITMMLSLISDRFWKQGWRARDLSYTGQMIRKKTFLVTDGTGNRLPAATGYRMIELADIAPEDVTSEAMNDQVEQTSRINARLEDRYRDRIDPGLLNLWFTDPSITLMLPVNAPKEDWQGRIALTQASPQAPGVFEAGDLAGIPDWKKPLGYPLRTFSPTEFGSEEELRKDRLYIARYNMAQALQREADTEYLDRKDEVTRWFVERCAANLHALVGLAALQAQGRWAGRGDDRGLLDGRRLLRLAPVKDPEWHLTLSLGSALACDEDGTPRCATTGAAAVSYRARFRPRDAEDLALLAGCSIPDLPDVLQHWNPHKDFAGNHLLTRLDPVEWVLTDPWIKLPLDVNFWLSKRGYAQALKSWPAARKPDTTG